MSQQPAGNKLFRARSRERGISLIETLVAMALGLLVLTGILQLMSQLVDGNTTTMKVVRLEQDTRTILDIIVQDLRRAGSFTEANRDLGDQNRFLQDQPAAPWIDGDPMISGKSGSSITYNYRESDGKLTQAKFAWDAKAGTVLMHTGTASAPETITDATTMVVKDLSFTPRLVEVPSGAMKMLQVMVDVGIRTQLKSDPSVERQLTDRVVLRNGRLESGR